MFESRNWKDFVYLVSVPLLFSLVHFLFVSHKYFNNPPELNIIRFIIFPLMCGFLLLFFLPERKDLSLFREDYPIFIYTLILMIIFGAMAFLIDVFVIK